MSTPEISIVIAVYNEEDNIPDLVTQIRETMEPLGKTYELILANDGSSDRSLELMCGYAAEDPRIRIIHLSRNSGQSAALAAGFRAARGTYVVTLDADLQNDPADIPKVLEALDGVDVVSGVRARRRDTWPRRIGSRWANGIRSWYLDDKVHDVGCSMKAYRREVLDDLPVFHGMHRFLPALVAMRGAKVREVDVHHRPRIHGDSKYTNWGRLKKTIFDLFGVRWLQSRYRDLRVASEIEDPQNYSAGGSGGTQPGP